MCPYLPDILLYIHTHFHNQFKFVLCIPLSHSHYKIHPSQPVLPHIYNGYNGTFIVQYIAMLVFVIFVFIHNPNSVTILLTQATHLPI